MNLLRFLDSHVCQLERSEHRLPITVTEFHTATFIISFIIHPYCYIYNTGFFKLYITKYIQLYKTVLVSIYELWHGTIHVTDSITCLVSHSYFLLSFYVGIDHLHSFFPIRCFYSNLLLYIVTPRNYCMGQKQVACRNHNEREQKLVQLNIPINIYTIWQEQKKFSNCKPISQVE